jgi:predicted CXXCH cytochrome family protein
MPPSASSSRPGLALLLALLSGCAGRDPSVRAYRNTDLSVGYVGREACVSCHPSVGESYALTGMGRSLYPLTPENVVEDFQVRNTLEYPSDHVSYAMTARTDGYWVRQTILGDDGKALAVAEKKIAYVVGSGNHSRSYLAGGNGYLYELPVCWYPGKPGWDLCPGFDTVNKFLTRDVDDSCLFCHDARVTILSPASHRFEEPLPHGIDCERCHGPGALHAARWKDPPDPPPENDDTIVNPMKLPKGMRMQVCFQCHLGDSDAGDRVAKPGRDLLDFRPGLGISDFLDVFSFDPPMENRFALGSQGDRLMLSRCFKESGGALDCLTCHDPHVSVYAKSRPADSFRKTCLGCHAAGACALPEPDRRARDAADDCVGCHMRRSQPADQRFTAFTDHWIRRRIDPPGPPATDRSSLALASILPKEKRAETDARAAVALGTAYVDKKTESAYSSRISWTEAERLLREAVDSDPTIVEGWYQVGRVAIAQGRVSEAMGAFREALRLSPHHRSARHRLGVALLVQGRAADAEPFFSAALEDDPQDLAAMSELARTLVAIGREEEADATLRRGLELDRENPTLLANAGLLAARRGRHLEAIDLLRRAVALDPSAPEVWQTLAGSLEAVGRADESLGPAARALALREKGRPRSGGSPPPPRRGAP